MYRKENLHMNKRISRPEKSIKSQVYDAILNDIINNEFPLDKYLTEKALMEKYQVSRSPVREALVQLQSERLISSTPRHGYLICRPDWKELRDIAAFRAMLECGFLSQYHHLITPEHIQSLRKLCYDHEQTSDQNFITLWKANTAFHAELFSFYGNQFALTALLDAIDRQVIYYIEVRDHFALSTDLHLAILDYLEKKEIKTALAVLQADIERLPTSSTAS